MKNSAPTSNRNKQKNFRYAVFRYTEKPSRVLTVGIFTIPRSDCPVNNFRIPGLKPE